MKNRILVVEDSPTQALKVQFLLEKAGYSVEIAENGKIGLGKALADPPDMIVADIVMPVMDGYEMTRRLKADTCTADVPVFMLTTKNQPLDVIRGLEVGADHFIYKPADDSLVQRIRIFFNRLEDALAGRLPEQQQLQQFSKEIVINESKEQILQSLLKATASIVDCQTMAILIHSPDAEYILFVISFKPLEVSVVERMKSKMANLLAQVRMESPAPMPARTVKIVIEPKSGVFGGDGDLLSSFLEVPLIVNEQIIGILGVFSSKEGAFELKHVSFLFDMGQKAAQALSKIKAG